MSGAALSKQLPFGVELRLAKYYSGTTTGAERADPGAADGRKASVLLGSGTAGFPRQPYDIFEGTEQIHQLVISRALSGMRIE